MADISEASGATVRQPDPKAVASAIINDENLTKNFITIVRKEVESEIFSQQERRLRFVALLSSLSGAGLVAIFAYLFSMFQENMERRFSDVVNQTVNTKLDTFREEIRNDTRIMMSDAEEDIHREIALVSENVNLRIASSENTTMSKLKEYSNDIETLKTKALPDKPPPEESLNNSVVDSDPSPSELVREPDDAVAALPPETPPETGAPASAAPTGSDVAPSTTDPSNGAETEAGDSEEPLSAFSSTVGSASNDEIAGNLLEKITGEIETLSQKNNLSQSDSARVMRAIESILALSVDQVVNSEEFGNGIESFIDVLAAAGSNDHIDHLDDIARDQIATNPGTVWTLVQHYGERLVGNKYSASGWPPDTVERFNAYTQFAHELELTDASTAVEMLVTFELSSGSRNDRTGSLLESISSLDESVKFWIALNLIKYTDASNWANFLTPDVTKIQDVAQRFCSTYRDEIREQLLFDEAMQAQIDFIDLPEPLNTNLLTAFKLGECPQPAKVGTINAPAAAAQ